MWRERDSSSNGVNARTGVSTSRKSKEASGEQDSDLYLCQAESPQGCSISRPL